MGFDRAISLTSLRLATNARARSLFAELELVPVFQFASSPPAFGPTMTPIT
jgi:hypothetical protein